MCKYCSHDISIHICIISLNYIPFHWTLTGRGMEHSTCRVSIPYYILHKIIIRSCGRSKVYRAWRCNRWILSDNHGHGPSRVPIEQSIIRFLVLVEYQLWRKCLFYKLADDDHVNSTISSVAMTFIISYYYYANWKRRMYRMKNVRDFVSINIE